MSYRVHLVLVGFELTSLVVIATYCIDSYKSNYHRITTTTAPWQHWDKIKNWKKWASGTSGKKRGKKFLFLNTVQIGSFPLETLDDSLINKMSLFHLSDHTCHIFRLCQNKNFQKNHQNQRLYTFTYLFLNCESKKLTFCILS
jgi:hypothetical protein